MSKSGRREVKRGGRFNVTARNKGNEEECFGIDSIDINQIKVVDTDEPELHNLHSDLFLSL